MNELLLDKLWAQLIKTYPPEALVLDIRTGKMFKYVSPEQKLLQEVTSPIGLARLFPGLKK